MVVEQHLNTAKWLVLKIEKLLCQFSSRGRFICRLAADIRQILDPDLALENTQLFQQVDQVVSSLRSLMNGEYT